MYGRKTSLEALNANLLERRQYLIPLEYGLEWFRRAAVHIIRFSMQRNKCTTLAMSLIGAQSFMQTR